MNTHVAQNPISCGAHRHTLRPNRLPSNPALQELTAKCSSRAPYGPTSSTSVVDAPQVELDEHGHAVGADSALAPHLIITTGFILAATAIALVVTDLGVVLEVVGATGSTTVSYILPGACYLIVSKKPRGPWHRRRCLALTMLIAGLVIMPLSLTLVVLKALHKV